MATKRRIVMNEAEANGITLDDAFKDFITKKEAKGVASDTIRNYKLSYSKFYSYFQMTPATLANEITQGNVIHWTKAMLKAELTPSSINHYLRDFRTFLNYMFDCEYLEPFKVDMVRYQEAAEKAFDKSNIEKLLEKPSKGDNFGTWRCWAMVNWVYATGNREATVCEVRIGDVNFNTNRIYLRHTKSKKFETIPLSQALSNCLKEYVRVCRKNSPQDAYLFPSIGDEQLTTNALRKSFTQYCKLREVEQHNFHGLRHSFAMGWINNDGNLYKLQVMLGHSTPTMTQKYLRSCGVEFNNFEDYNPLDVIKSKASRTKKV